MSFAILCVFVCAWIECEGNKKIMTPISEMKKMIDKKRDYQERLHVAMTDFCDNTTTSATKIKIARNITLSGCKPHQISHLTIAFVPILQLVH
jgi:hypothetical protein